MILKQISKFTVIEIIMAIGALTAVWYFVDILGFMGWQTAIVLGAIGMIVRFVLNKWVVFKDEKRI